ncbi:MAG TPA: sulfite oxidase-like oxidoreductase [Aigarchaeota archaeon]|nr:sulfite oxidase-like oxidoreductase [Aigarchaeota archaeon]
MQETNLPPGQVWIKEWIIYAALGIPKVDTSNWRLVVDGLVENRLEITFEELQRFPSVKVVKPFYCVTKWSIKDVEWEGVRIKDLAERAGVLPEASWVMFHCVDGYTAPVPLEDAVAEDSIIAYKMNGRYLSVEQGFPARPFIPHLYGWKSAKWLDRIEFIREYVDGYWEAYGYHERGNVWLEERFKEGGRHVKRAPAGSRG